MISWLAKRFKTVEGLSDYILVKMAKRGDCDAFGKIYLKYLDGIYRYIYFRVNQNEQTAEDLAETVFFRAWNHIKVFDENSGTLKSWLYRIAHNAVIDHFRDNRKQVTLEEGLVEEKVSLEEKIIQNFELRELAQAINKLTDEQKQVITLRFIEDMTNDEIAKIVNKKEDAVRALQSRALKKLRNLLVK
ncbi:MAG: sigma-70 family RNA polymerase sigma factor [Patescibacteria group bacterium]|nr:sigma-70 family RNA polymerase sigma factor [Patescibacteria group bacterium]